MDKAFVSGHPLSASPILVPVALSGRAVEQVPAMLPIREPTLSVMIMTCAPLAMPAMELEGVPVRPSFASPTLVAAAASEPATAQVPAMSPIQVQTLSAMTTTSAHSAMYAMERGAALGHPSSVKMRTRSAAL